MNHNHYIGDGGFRRVTRSEPCPICHKHDWCLIAGPENNPTAAICGRLESPKRAGNAGYLHQLHRGNWQPTWSREATIPIATQHAPPNWAKIAINCMAAMTGCKLPRLAVSLGLSETSLKRLQIGWSEVHDAFAFPMRDATGRPVGIRLRRPNGFKFAWTGSHEGLFLPPELIAGSGPVERLLIAEGPTDTAALLDCDLIAIGRPSCLGGIDTIVRLVDRLQVAEAVIVADGDQPGQRGADRLASRLVGYVKLLRVISPPSGIKDVREWKRRGAEAQDILVAIHAAAPRKLRISITCKEGQ